LLFSKAKTAIFGFIFGAFLIFLLKSESKTSAFGYSFLTLFQLVLVGIYLFYIPHFVQKEILSSPVVAVTKPALSTLPLEKRPILPKSKISPQPKQVSTPPKNLSTHKKTLKTPAEISLFTLGGRTIGIWPKAFKLFLRSPLIGLGFHADRIFLKGQHAHNAILHSLIQTGLIGTVFFILAFILTWIGLFKLLKKTIREKPFLVEIAAIFVFFAIRAITESTGAFFGVDWIILAPLLGYITILNRQKE
jgi:O-antigen ligase